MDPTGTRTKKEKILNQGDIVDTRGRGNNKNSIHHPQIYPPPPLFEPGTFKLIPYPTDRNYLSFLVEVDRVYTPDYSEETCG